MKVDQSSSAFQRNEGFDLLKVCCWEGSALRHARTMKLQIVGLSDEWAKRESKIVNRAHSPLPKLAVELIRHLANFNFEERLL